MRAIKRVGNILSTLLVIIVMLLAVLLVGVRLIGLTPYTVLSGSMEPAYHVGSLIYVKEIEPSQIEVGMPITFVVNEDLLVATHRVIGIESYTTKDEPVLDADGNPTYDEHGDVVMQTVPLEETSYYFKTKGDANDAEDGSPVYYKNVIGTPVFTLPYLGYLSSYLQTRKGMIIGITAALVMLILTFMPDLLDLVDDEPKKKPKKKAHSNKKKHPQKPREIPQERPVERPAPKPIEAPKPAPAPAAAEQPVQTAEPSAPARRRRAQAVQAEIPAPQEIPEPSTDAPRRRRRQQV